ncbi:MAG TPA: ATP-binding cassette domain-containing protein [Bryobacteraceae bacterium]|jgi:phospholipid/cholesterol/gamma-HCH transport system ATP-binding protein|nr:ATP-binding cassette domain-containing protein [Bryobacteraceae bacterium]
MILASEHEAQSSPAQGSRGEVLRFDNVTVRFDQETALDAVSFSMSAGETRILLGAAGSGKTVLIKTAVGLIRADAGRVYLFGTDITDMDERHLFDLRAKVGILFQEGGLFDSMTIEENVAYPLVNQRARTPMPAEVVQEKVLEALSFVELERTVAQFPSELSGGMRRRVGIARAVVTEPPLVLYDSPTAGLDPITATTIMALIVKERDLRNTAAVVATHRYQDGQLMANFRYNPQRGALERVSSDGKNGLKTTFMVMRDGRIAFEGSEAELESSTDPYIAKFVKR